MLFRFPALGLFRTLVRCGLCATMLAGALAASTSQDFLSKPPAEWTEAEALTVLNDSPWAHRVEATTEGTADFYDHDGPGGKPTNIKEGWYNAADELTFSVILKHTGTAGESFRDYAFQRKNGIWSERIAHIFTCSGIRTANGHFHGLVASMCMKDGEVTGLRISFPRVVDGKPLILRKEEKLEFRLVANGHIFQTTFYVSPGDLFDGTETTLRIPPTVDE